MRYVPVVMRWVSAALIILGMWAGHETIIFVAAVLYIGAAVDGAADTISERVDGAADSVDAITDRIS